MIRPKLLLVTEFRASVIIFFSFSPFFNLVLNAMS